MAEYKKATDRTYDKTDEMKLKIGARVDGDKTYSMLEICGEKREERGTTVGAEGRAHVFQVGDKHANARFLGGDLGASAGMDFEGFVEDGHVLGVETKARATLTECTAGPVNLHLGAGVSTGAKVEGGTADVKLSGCGVKVGKRIGVSVFDNEISIDTLSLVGKGWLW